jgi:hypothetical protein
MSLIPQEDLQEPMFQDVKELTTALPGRRKCAGFGCPTVLRIRPHETLAGFANRKYCQGCQDERGASPGAAGRPL